MRTVLSVAMIMLFAAGSVSADKEFTFDKKDNFDGAAISTITVDVDRGQISIEKSRGQNIEVLYKNSVFADNQSQADEINEDYKYSAKVTGNELAIVVETPRHGRKGMDIVERIIEGDWSQEGSYPMIKLVIPDGKAVDIMSASSDIEVSELVVDLDIQSSSSDVDLENTQGKLSCRLSSGDINIGGHKGSILTKGKSSDIRIVDVEGPVEAATASGDITVEKVKGMVESQSASGDNRLFEITGDIDAEAVSGDIEISTVTGSVRASAVSGDVRLDGLAAKDGDYDISSVSGDIHMAVSRDFAGQIVLHSVSGNVNSRLPGKVVFEVDDEDDNDSRSEVRGTVGQGDGRLNATTTSGDITVDGY
jgi:hypothetical protein